MGCEACGTGQGDGKKRKDAKKQRRGVGVVRVELGEEIEAVERLVIVAFA